MSARRPPRIAERWLRLVLPPDVATAFGGDLAEEYQEIARRRRLPALWYSWQVACVTGRYLLETLSPSPASPRSIVQGLGHDIRLGFRSLVKTPLFSLFVVGTLALAIGINAAVFSLAHSALLRPYPYPEPERLVQIEAAERRTDDRIVESPYLTFLEWRQRARTFDAMGAYVTFGLNMAGDHGSEPIQTTFASASLFPLLGVEPVIGRVYTGTDDAPGGDIYQVVISHGLWQRRFGGQPSAIGQRLLLDMEAYTVIGVMPPGFGFPARSDVWAPAERWSYRTSPGLRSHRVVGRVARTSTLEQARADMDAISRQLERESSTGSDGARAVVIPLRDAELGQLKRYFLVLPAAAALLLLIACANVASLMTVRGIGRIPEFAVRRAIGMSGWRMLRQLVAESLVLAAIGGTLGFLLAMEGVALLPAIIPVDLPPWLHVRPETTMLRACLVLTLATTVIFGCAPAIAQMRGSLTERLRSTSRATGTRIGHGRTMLTGLQVALSLVLLGGAGLLLRTAVNLHDQDLGFQPRGLLTAHLSLAYDKFPKAMPVRERIAQQTRDFRRMLERLRALPGVEHVAGASAAPFELRGAHSQSRVTAEGQDAQSQRQNPYSERLIVSPDYFATLTMPLIAGRAFDDDDRLDRPSVAIVNRSLAQRLWPDGKALGKRLKLGAVEDPRPWLQVVGVATDVRHRGLDSAPDMVVYTPDGQGYPGTYTFLLRLPADLPSAETVAAAVTSIDPGQAVFAVRTMDRLIAGSTWPRTLTATLLSLFGGLALLLAATGIYGVLSHIVMQRTREIGVRLALGAQFADVVQLVLRQSLVMIGGGLVAGLLVLTLASRGLAGLLFGVTPGDPLTLATVVALLLSVAFVACYLPARRAARAGVRAVLQGE